MQYPDLDGEEIGAYLKQFISSHTYLDCSAKDFREKLLYSMSIGKLGEIMSNDCRRDYGMVDEIASSYVSEKDG